MNTAPDAARRYIRATCRPQPDDTARMAQDFETAQGRAVAEAESYRRLRLARAAARAIAVAVTLLCVAVLAAWALHAAAVAAAAVSDPAHGMPW